MLDFSLVLDNSNGENVILTDTSTDISYSSIVAVRFQFGNNLEPQQELSTGDLEQYRKYVKTLGSASIYDNKTESVGSIYIPFIDVPINSGDTWEYLQIYSPFVEVNVSGSGSVQVENSSGSYTATANPPLFILPDTNKPSSPAIQSDLLYLGMPMLVRYISLCLIAHCID